MNSIFITGSTGFVGQNVINYFQDRFLFKKFKTNDEISINENIVLHFAGKAHDLKRTFNIDEYYIVNTELTKQLFDNFLSSTAEIFIILSSVKAVADELDNDLTEDMIPNPKTHYGKSKFLAEKYILSKKKSDWKRVFILRPGMIHGPGNKGNLNLLYKIVNLGIPWPLGAFENKRSFCSIDNLCFIINELIENIEIPSGIYNISDDDPVSTNELIKLISKSQGKKSFIWNIPKFFIKIFSKIGDAFRLPLNSERLLKLTDNYIISNKKIKKAINKKLPMNSIEGLTKTFNSFKND